MPAEKTSLYRLFNAADELLYIGISHDPDSRWSQHQTLTPWIREVATRTIEWHESREIALAAEAKTIRAERPRYNVVHRPVAVAPEAAAAAEEALRAAVAGYKAAVPRALEARDEAIRKASDAGLKQIDIVRVTGYTRETIRRALNPEVRAAVKKAAEERKATKEDS